MGSVTTKSAVVTGAGSGIGRAAAMILAEEGASLVLTGRRREALEETAAQLTGAGECMISPGDITDAAAMSEIAKAIGKKFGRLDVMINNAGTNIPVRKWNELRPEGVDTLIHTNLSSAFYCVMAALPLMRKNQYRLFIHIGSRAGTSSAPSSCRRRPAMACRLATSIARSSSTNA